MAEAVLTRSQKKTAKKKSLSSPVLIRLSVGM
jgi:hypothetical protein